MKNRFFLSLLLLLVVLEARAQDKDIYFITVNNYAIIQKDGIESPWILESVMIMPAFI